MNNFRFSDNRFKKLIEDPRRKTLAVIDYLKKKASKTSVKSNGEKESKPYSAKSIDKDECVLGVPVIIVSIKLIM